MKSKYPAIESISSSSLSEKYGEEYLGNTSLLDNKTISKILPSISIEDLNNYIRNQIKDKDRDIIITAPAGSDISIPGEKDFIRWTGEVEKEQLVQKQRIIGDSILPVDRYPIEPEDVIFARVDYDTINMTTLRLGNGAKVVLKPSNSNDGVLQMSVFRKINVADSNVLQYLHIIQNELGIAGHTKFDILSFNQKNGINIACYFSSEVHRITIGSIAGNMDKLVQLMYGYFTLASLPDASVDYLLKNDSPINKAELEKTMLIIKQFFANAANFTFIIAGDFDIDQTIPVVVKYLHPLPGSGVKDSTVNKVKAVDSQKIRITYTGIEDKSEVSIQIKGAYQYGAQNNLYIDALGSVLYLRMINRLRFKEQGTYAPMVFAVYDDDFNIYISFLCAPSRAEQLIAAALEEIAAVRRNGPLEEDLKKFIVTESEGIDSNLLQGKIGYWFPYLERVCMNGGDFMEIVRRKESLKKLTVKDLQHAAEKYLAPENIYQRIQFPVQMKD